MASAELWPEIVYPLIEHAHWQRTFRPRLEAFWDYVVGKLLRVPVPGVRLDRMMVIAIPLEVAEQLDEDLFAFVANTRLDADWDEASPSETERPPSDVRSGWDHDPPRGAAERRRSPARQGDDPLSPPDPFVFTQNSLHNLWEQAMEAQANSARPVVLHRKIPVGPYELAVIPTGRGRSAVRSVLQGMPQGKQIELFTPLALPRDRTPRTVVAIWIYQDASMAVVHLDFKSRNVTSSGTLGTPISSTSRCRGAENPTIHHEPGDSRPPRRDPREEMTVPRSVWRGLRVLSGRTKDARRTTMTNEFPRWLMPGSDAVPESGRFRWRELVGRRGIEHDEQHLWLSHASLPQREAIAAAGEKSASDCIGMTLRFGVRSAGSVDGSGGASPFGVPLAIPAGRTAGVSLRRSSWVGTIGSGPCRAVRGPPGRARTARG